MLYCVLTFTDLTSLQKKLRSTIDVSNGLDPDEDRRSVCPDLNPNHLQRLSLDDNSRY